MRQGWTTSLVIPALVSGCALIPGLRVSEARITEPEGYQLVEITPAAIAGSRQSATALAGSLQPIDPGAPLTEYVIGAGDVLSVIVWEHPELTIPMGEFRDPVQGGRLVAADGTLFYPYAGALKVAGKTCAQVQSEITRALARVIKEPQVEVRVAGFRSRRIQVSGEVRQPGVVTLDDLPKGVLEALNERGGLTETASRREALLIRDGQTHRIRLAALLSGARPGSNPQLRAGDIVHVPHASEDQVFVLGEVGQPAPVPIQNGFMTLTEALTISGGLDRLTANDSGVLVFRRAAAADGGKGPTVFRLDLSEPEGLLLAGEFELQPRDVVYVKATAFAQYNSVINQLLPTISAIFQVDRLTDD
jgi:polysaccharide export outer membrane protein